MSRLMKLLCLVFIVSLSACSFITVGAAQKIQIRVMTRWSGSDANAPALQKLVKEFNQKNKDIEIVDESITDSTGYDNKIKAGVATGNLPHIFQVWGEAYDYAKNGLLLDLKPYYAADKKWAGGFVPGLCKSVGSFPKLPGQYVVPMENSYEVFFYNTELFAKAGINKAPETYQELLSDIKKLNEAGIVPIGAGAKDSWRLGHIFTGLMHKNVGVQKSLDIGTGKAKFTDANIVATIKLVKQLVNVGAFDKNFAGIDYQSEKTNFLNGKSAMVYNGMWFVGEVSASPIKDKIKTFLMPTTNPKYKDNDIAYAAGFACNNLIKNQAEKKAMITVMKYLSGPEAGDTFTEICKRPPVRIDIKTDLSKVDPILSEVIQQEKVIKKFGSDVEGATLKAKMYDIIRNGLVALALGVKTPEDLAKEWQAEMEKD